METMSEEPWVYVLLVVGALLVLAPGLEILLDDHNLPSRKRRGSKQINYS